MQVKLKEKLSNIRKRNSDSHDVFLQLQGLLIEVAIYSKVYIAMTHLKTWRLQINVINPRRTLTSKLLLQAKYIPLANPEQTCVKTQIEISVLIRPGIETQPGYANTKSASLQVSIFVFINGNAELTCR